MREGENGNHEWQLIQKRCEEEHAESSKIRAELQEVHSNQRSVMANQESGLSRLKQLEIIVHEIRNSVSVMANSIDVIENDLYNHGRDGLKTIVIKSIERQESYRLDRERSEKAFRFWLMFALTAIGMILVPIFLLFINEQIHKGILEVPQIFNSQIPFQAYNLNQLSARW